MVETVIRLPGNPAGSYNVTLRITARLIMTPHFTRFKKFLKGFNAKIINPETEELKATTKVVLRW